jgi:hypothetical protein
MVAFFVPILFGMTAFRVIALAAYLVTTVYFLVLRVRVRTDTKEVATSEA